MNAQGLSQFLDRGHPVVQIRLTGVRGSSPREAGTEMFVTKTGSLGTIGGGQLEHMAIEAARTLLEAGDLATELDIPLGPEIGQCCGGHVSVSLSRMSEAGWASALKRTEAEELDRPHVYIMGSGHVGRALADLFQHMPFHTVVVDQRESELAQCLATVEKRISAIPEIEIMTAPPSSAFIVLTHEHALDFLLTGAALGRGDAAYVGLIGSATKRAKFRNWFRQSSDSTTIDTLVCPIGNSKSRDKRPEIIAACVLAEVAVALSEKKATRQRNPEIAEPLAAVPLEVRRQSRAPINSRAEHLPYRGKFRFQQKSED